MAAVVLYNILIFIPIKNYSLDVDPLKDPESILTNSRVILKNTGKLTLTNIEVTYDNNANKTDKLVSLEPGQTTILSPPQGSLLKTVKVKTAEGINIEKGYRTPTKLPGMIGS